MNKAITQRIALLIVLFYVGITAIWGGIGLVFSGGSTFGLPEELLRTTPFSTYTIPGLLLGVVVGGSNILALIFLMRRDKLQYEATATAGFGLLIWLFTELFLLPDSHWIQIVYFILAILIIILTMLGVKQKVI